MRAQPAPRAVPKLTSLASGRGSTELPFFHVTQDMALFGVQPDAEKQRTFDLKGDIKDDAFPKVHSEERKGILCFSGDPGGKNFGEHTRSTIVFVTLNEHKQLMSNRRTPWEVPVGKVTSGLDVLKSVYAGHGEKPKLSWLNSTNTRRPAGVPDAAGYWAKFPELDRFLGCRVTRDEKPGSDPNRLRLADEL